ncbi:uncharacterized protein LOC143879188 [Tasmannia lanceolata]|uniref:uncharacterized protein LOC143879188 n=1 Tax=Tasmannia lanceolata TaxID=3420 RepID=UPI004063E565
MEEIETGISSLNLYFHEKKEKWIKHYSNSHRILLVGEGDFSFALSLANAFGSATNMVATSLDNQDTLESKYSYAIGNVRELEEMGCLILYGIDATKMSTHFFLRTQRFDRIVYNFPHVGFRYPEGSNFQIQRATIMGGRQSRRMPFSSHYSRLAPISPPPEKQPLLDMNYDLQKSYSPIGSIKGMEKYVPMEKFRERSAALERNVDELRRKVDRLESMSSEDLKRQGTEIESIRKRKSSLEKKVSGLGKKVEDLEITSQNNSVTKEHESVFRTISEKNVALERNVNELKTKVKRLEAMTKDVSCKKEPDQTLEMLCKRITELEGCLGPLKHKEENYKSLKGLDGLAIEDSNTYFEDLVGCFLVLIFVVSILIGLLL